MTGSMEDTIAQVAYSRAYPSRSYARLKRSLDILIAGFALILFGPLILCCCLAVKIVSPGPALVRIRRVGLHGEPFDMLKIRTMVTDADKHLQDHLKASPQAALEWATSFKLKKDPRIIPRLGTMLRRTSIDELPQLINILLGTMSVVGPRPFPDYHLSSFSAEFRARRQSVKPGLTGLWQVDRGAIPSLREQEALDLRYIGEQSLALDMYIVARTFGAVRRGTGSY
jgi:lipopolysaccharide/colanic/teichoic acid biosynthesis glycosyltransferase